MDNSLTKLQHFMKPVHTWAGLIAYMLVVIQIMLALYQFKRKFMKRFYFKWFHRILATVAFIAACVIFDIYFFFFFAH